MGLIEYASIAVIVYIAMSLLLKFTLIAMYLYGMYQFMKDTDDHKSSLTDSLVEGYRLGRENSNQPKVDSDQFNPDLI